MDAPPPLGIRTAARYRVAPEAAIVEMLVLLGWAIDAMAGRREQARREAASTLERWIAMGLAYERSPSGERRFDPAEVSNFPRRAPDPFYAERFVPQGRAIVLAFHRRVASRDAPPPPDTLPPERFTVTHSREFALAPAARGARTLLRMPLPIEDETLTGLRHELVAPPGLDAEAVASTGRLDVRVRAPGAPTVTLSVRTTFVSDPSGRGAAHTPLSASERELYTRPVEGVVRVTPRIRALADELAAGERGGFAIASRCIDFVIERLTCGVVHYDELDPAAPTDWVLDSRWYDCHMGSALVVAMCRARGIPARLVAGNLLLPAIASGHYWLEVWDEDHGWMPIDTNVGDLSMRGRDRAWRDYFVGRLDYRMKTQVLPRVFNLAPSVRFPHTWHLLTRIAGDGVESATFDSATGALVYRDHLVIRRGDDPPGAYLPPAVVPSIVNATPL